MNNVNLIGCLTKDVELQIIKGYKLAQFSIATNRRRKNASGEAEQETCFIDVVAWGKTAEVVSLYFKKGNRIGVSGYLSQRVWNNKNGEKRSKHIVVLEKLDFLERKESQAQEVAPRAQKVQEVQEPYVEFIDADSDEIPF